MSPRRLLPLLALLTVIIAACGTPPSAPPVAPTEPLTATSAAPTEAAPPPTDSASPTVAPPAYTTLPAEPFASFDAGPWRLHLLEVNGQNELWRARADGTDLGSDPQRVTGALVQFFLPIDLIGGYNPQRDLLALLTGDMLQSQFTLEIHDLTNPGAPLTTLNITAGLTLSEATLEPGDPAFEALRALEVSPPVWSPNGDALAFMGIIDGPSSDLYTWDADTGNLARLTDGAAQGVEPHWSTEGTYIWHFAVDSLGTGAGYAMSGVYAARADNTQVTDLGLQPNWSAVEYIAWVDDQTVLTNGWNAACGPRDIRKIDAATGRPIILWSGSFYTAIYNPAERRLEVTVDSLTAECDPGLVVGSFTVNVDTGEIQQVATSDY